MWCQGDWWGFQSVGGGCWLSSSPVARDSRAAVVRRGAGLSRRLSAVILGRHLLLVGQVHSRTNEYGIRHPTSDKISLKKAACATPAIPLIPLLLVMKRPLKLVSLNAYLIAKSFNQNRDTQVEKRSRRLEAWIDRTSPDLCFLQEVWGSALPAFKHWEVPPYRKPYMAWKILSDAVHTLSIYLMSTGGLYDLAKPTSATCIHRSKETFQVSRSSSRKGAEASLWKLHLWKDDEQDEKGSHITSTSNHDHYYMLVFNTHLDPWMPQNRHQQIQQILSFFESTINSLDVDWSRTGVLILGDFNIVANSDEYKKLPREWKDLFDDHDQSRERQADHFTYSQQNHWASSSDDFGRIDYIFSVQEFRGRHFLPLECTTRSLEKQSPGEEFSDHYPLMIELLPKKKD